MAALQPLESRLTKLEQRIEGAVSFRVFSWVILLLVTLWLAQASWISFQINRLNEISFDTRSEVAKLNGKLDPFQIQFKD